MITRAELSCTIIRSCDECFNQRLTPCAMLVVVMLNQMLKEGSYLDVPFAEVISNHEVRNGYPTSVLWQLEELSRAAKRESRRQSHTKQHWRHGEIMDKEMQHVTTTDLIVWTTFVGSWSVECGSNFLLNLCAKETQNLAGRSFFEVPIKVIQLS